MRNQAVRSLGVALLAGVSTFATGAVAQDAPAPSGTGKVEEVVVTAERRQERLHDVPAAVSVVSPEQLSAANVVGLTNLQLLAPSVQYNSYLGGGFQIRGIGTQTVNLTTEQDVGVVLDDVVQGMPELTFAVPSYEALTDVERIEVLKGPQGTLFGKNSSVGVIQVITKKPDFSAFEADGSVSYGSYGEVRAEANVNIPITDQLAVRISGFDYHENGFITNLYNGDKLGGYDHYGVRGKVLWQPLSDLSVYLIAEHMNTNDPGNGAWTLRSCGSGFFDTNPCTTDIPLGVHPGPDNTTVALNSATPARTKTDSGSLKIEYGFDGNTLTSVSGVIAEDAFENVDVDNTPLNTLSLDASNTSSRQFTQEIRLTSPSDQFIEYTVGAYYYNLASNFSNVLAGTFGFLPNNSPILLSNGFAGLVSGGQTLLQTGTQSYAIYGQATAHVTDKFSLTGGARLTADNVQANVHVVPYAGVCAFGYAFGGPCHPVPLPSPIVSSNTQANNVSGKVTAKYDFTDDINGYLSFATGYKGPAISYTALAPFSPIAPETSTAYEAGVKSDLFDRTVQINADVFYEKFKNFQADTYVYNASDPAASNFEAANAGGLESKGLEADVTWVATDNLTLTGNLAYTPTDFTDFIIQCQNQYTNPATVGTCYTDPKTGVQLFNAKGYPLPQAPKTTFALGANYVRPLWAGYQLDADANYVWRSSTYTVAANPNTVQGGYGLLGAQLGVGPEDGRWKISVYGRNLTDQKFVSAIFPTFLDNGALTGIPLPTQGYSNVPSIEARRFVGVKLDVAFSP